MKDAEPVAPPLGNEDREQLTALLQAWGGGDRQALESLVPLVYGELKILAGAQLRNERADHTLQATALVHEAFLRLAEHPCVRWQNRRHFFAVAARTMRRLLVDHARRRGAEKRGGGARALRLEADVTPAVDRDEDLVLLDLSLAELYSLDPLKAWIVELRYFGGFSVDETADIVGRSRATVVRQWRVARAWLYRSIYGDGSRVARRSGGRHGA